MGLLGVIPKVTSSVTQLYPCVRESSSLGETALKSWWPEKHRIGLWEEPEFSPKNPGSLRPYVVTNQPVLCAGAPPAVCPYLPTEGKKACPTHLTGCLENRE